MSGSSATRNMKTPDLFRLSAEGFTPREPLLDFPHVVSSTLASPHPTVLPLKLFERSAMLLFLTRSSQHPAQLLFPRVELCIPPLGHRNSRLSGPFVFDPGHHRAQYVWSWEGSGLLYAQLLDVGAASERSARHASTHFCSLRRAVVANSTRTAQEEALSSRSTSYHSATLR